MSTRQTLKRKTRSDKFPLTLHPTGQYCKKVKGKMYYFGSDRDKHLKNTWTKRHICMEVKTICNNKNQQAII